MSSTPAPDRLRELLDVVLDEENQSLAEMAEDAFASRFHFARQLRLGAGESPVAMRRRVLLERAAWRLRSGADVTGSAFEAGYASVEGFVRAFGRAYGHPPGELIDRAGGHWLPAPNGIHFHPPMSLWVDSSQTPEQPVAEQPAAEQSGSAVTALLVRHDLDDAGDLLVAAQGLDEEAFHRVRMPGAMCLEWDGPDETIAQVLSHLVHSKEVWLASIEGGAPPMQTSGTAADLLLRHRRVAPGWLARMQDIERRRAWGDRLIDALCEPPESFVLSSVLAHVLTFSAHRRQVLRWMLRDQLPAERQASIPDPDPITWLRRQHGTNA